MALCYEDGKPFDCPPTGRLLAIVENHEGLIRVRFASDIKEPAHPYTGKRRLMYPTEGGDYTDEGVSLFMQKAGEKPNYQIVGIVTALIYAVARFKPDPQYGRKETKDHRIIIAFAPLPPIGV